MEQDVRFCTTSDGISIAYTSLGSGPPLVQVLGWATHVEFGAQLPGMEQSMWTLLARNHHYYIYDGRGFGLSDRGVTDFSLDAKIRDLEAVVDAAGLKRFDIIGASEGGPTAMAYANRHPERVRRLVVYGSFARLVPPETEAEQMEMRLRMMAILPGWGKDTPEFRQLWTMQFMPGGSPELFQWFNELQRRSADASTVTALMGAIVRIDVRDEARQIKAPTLVVHCRGDRAVKFERGREIASLIPNAKFVSIESDNHFPIPGDRATHRLVQVIDDFLADSGAGGPSEPTTGQAAPSGLVTIFFTDMEGSTSPTQRLGDDKAQEILREHNAIVREALKGHAGSEIKHTGDGIMASFGSASGALDCAVAIQRAFAERSLSLRSQGSPSTSSGRAEETAIRVRIGLNAGEPVAEESDLFGSAVQLAARVCAQAEPGRILVSNVVRELAMGKGHLFADVGEVALRGFEDPVRLYEVKWED